MIILILFLNNKPKIYELQMKFYQKKMIQKVYCLSFLADY